MQMENADEVIKNRKSLLMSQAAQFLQILEGTDLPPTSQVKQAAVEVIHQMKKTTGR
jgi:hypothetical protein